VSWASCSQLSSWTTRARNTFPPLDLTGFLLIGAGFSGLILGFETIGEGLLPRWVNLLAVLLAAAAIGPMSVMRDGRPRRPRSLAAAHPHVLRQRLGGGLFRIGIGALPFLLPLMLQAASATARLLPG
jgi:hypothetical protein